MPFFPPIQQEQYPATDETQCIEIKIPAGDEFKALLAGLMVSASDVNNYADPLSPAADGLAAIWDQAYSEIDWTGCMPPSLTGNQTRVSLWHRWTQVTTGNPIGTVFDVSQLWGHYARQNTPADGDDGYQDVWLSAGEYEIRVLYLRSTNSAKLTVVFQYQPDSSQVVAINQADLYGTLAYNQVVTEQFTLTESGHYRVYFVANGKNASSSSFFILLTETEIWKTAD